MAMGSCLKSSEVCDKVLACFSVNIYTEDIKDYPEFEFLLDELCDYVDAEGLSKTVNAEFQQSQEKLRDVKSSYFEYEIIRSALEDAMRKFHLKSLQQMPTELEFELYSTVSNRESCSDICSKYMSPDKDGNERLICLSKDFALSCFDPVNSEMLQELILPEIEESIQEDCKTVLHYHDPDTNDGSTFSGMSKFSSVIQKEVTNLRDLKENILRDKKVTVRQIRNYCKCMVDCLKMMEKLADLRKREINFQSTMAKFFRAKCEGIGMKARILELQLLNDTYTPDSISALRVIRNQLLTKESQMEQELAEKNIALEQYEAVGASFNLLVEEYTQLSTAIENEKWALDELGRSETL